MFTFDVAFDFGVEKLMVWNDAADARWKTLEIDTTIVIYNVGWQEKPAFASEQFQLCSSSTFVIASHYATPPTVTELVTEDDPALIELAESHRVSDFDANSTLPFVACPH